MIARRYVEKHGSAAMLAAKRSAVVTPEANLRDRPLPSTNKASPEVQNRGISGLTKRTYVLQNLFILLFCGFLFNKNTKLRVSM